MSTLRRLTATDILLFGDCNLDPLTETYNVGYYLDYLAKWPSLCFVMKNQAGHVEGYRTCLSHLPSLSIPYSSTSPIPSPSLLIYYTLDHEYMPTRLVLGKVESSPAPNRPTAEPYDPNTNTNEHYLPWHAHITALTVSPSARRQGHAQKMTEALEQEAEREDAWFVDLFVRSDNGVAVGLYEGLG